MKRISIIALIIALFLPLLVGGISAALSAEGMKAYNAMNKPPLTPPPQVFSVVWTILYVMMGAASYLIFVADTGIRTKTMALVIFEVQLAMNFLWSIIFFNRRDYLLAFVWLIIMTVIVFVCAYKFYRIEKAATYLLVPYILWLLFAGYLNFGAYVMNINM